jgi:hypothetical protein
LAVEATASSVLNANEESSQAMVVRFFSIVENKKTAIIASHTANVAD